MIKNEAKWYHWPGYPPIFLNLQMSYIDQEFSLHTVRFDVLGGKMDTNKSIAVMEWVLVEVQEIINDFLNSMI